MPAVTTAPAAMDPTLLALLSIFGGAALTVAAGFVGAGIQARREHARWLRERRFDAYTALSEYLHRNKILTHDLHVKLQKTAALVERLESATEEDERVELRDEIQRLVAGDVSFEANMKANADARFPAVAAVMILGPAYVRAAAQAAINVPVEDQQGRSRADDVLDAAMRRALGIRD